MNNILFLDDEPIVLSALRRALAPKRKEWKMHFAESAADAWAILEENPIDIVVSDMRMPNVDGATFLAGVYERKPGTIRMVLSGFHDADSAVRATTAHRFLMKPIQSEDLISHVTSAMAAVQGPHAETLRSVGVLPITPDSITELKALLGSPLPRIGDIAVVAQREPALVAKILHMANSGMFAGRTQRLSLESCLTGLGLESFAKLLTELDQAQDPDRVAAATPLIMHARDAASQALLRPGLTVESRDIVQAGAMLHVLGNFSLTGDGQACDCAAGATSSAELLGLWGVPQPIVEAVGSFDPSS